ncbi:hypothetical protein MTO96_042209, partial [Rhipicephalus appendiculatus]
QTHRPYGSWQANSWTEALWALAVQRRLPAAAAQAPTAAPTPSRPPARTTVVSCGAPASTCTRQFGHRPLSSFAETPQLPASSVVSGGRGLHEARFLRRFQRHECHLSEENEKRS